MSRHIKPIDKLMDCQHVKRWALVHTTAESNVASHSFNVAMLAMAIFNRARNIGDSSVQEVCYYALMHDVDEAETGDMPTPTKLAIRAAGVEPNRLFPTQGLVGGMPDRLRVIIKLADLIENYVFIKEHGAGARARWAVSEVSGRLDEALDGAPEDVAEAAAWVLEYVENRRSDEDEERERLEETIKRRSYLVPLTLPPIVGREPRNGTGGP